VAFVQIIEFRSHKIDQVRKLNDEWDERVGSNTTATRGVLCEDRDNPGRYFELVFFDSYESAMKNSESPVTQEFAARMAALADGAPTFHNLNVIEERTY
jgi:hypothetical protein